MDVNRGANPVLTELFRMEKIPSILDKDEYGLQAIAAPAIEPDTFHLAVYGVGLEGNFPPAKLYHAESDAVETLPFRKVWGFSSDDEWLFLFEGVYIGGYEAGYHLWARRVEDMGGKWRLIAPSMDYVLWREDESEMAFVQNETTVVRKTFPQGEPVGRWHTGGYWAQPVAFSPDGRYLVGLGNKPGEWQYGLFMLRR
jgi:hypothetical protein